ncbi:MAG: DUF1840 domain-containing protein [Gallionella sp.]
MLVTFKTKAYADITMFGDVSLTLLKMMGHSGTVPSAIEAEDIPAALEQLQTAIRMNKSAESSGDKDDAEPKIGIAKRALPLIELLTAAAEAKTYVMWE